MKYLGRSAAACLLGAALLSGCATMAPEMPDEAVKARAHAYWQAIIGGDWEKAYSFATPAYRKAMDLFKYRRAHDGFVKYEGAEVVSTDCAEPDVCKLKVKLNVIINIDRKEKVTKVIEERWMLESGNWYRYIRR